MTLLFAIGQIKTLLCVMTWTFHVDRGKFVGLDSEQLSKSSCHKHVSRFFLLFYNSRFCQRAVESFSEYLGQSISVCCIPFGQATFFRRGTCFSALHHLVSGISHSLASCFKTDINWVMSIRFIILSDWLKNLVSYYHPIRLFKKFMPRHPINAKSYYVMLSLVFPR